MNDEWVQELYKKYGKHVLQYLSRHTANIEDAEDILQEILLSCHKSKDTFDKSRCNEEAWLFILAHNRLKNYYRDKNSRKVLILRFFDNSPPAQIASLLGIDEGNVRIIQYRALKKLRYLMLETEEITG